MPPTDLTPSQALDVLDSEEAVPDTEMSFPGHEVTAECDNDDNSVGNDMVSIEGKLSSPRESSDLGLMMMIYHKLIKIRFKLSHNHHRRILYYYENDGMTRN